MLVLVPPIASLPADRRGRAGGFTLIEMMIGLVIVALLVAMALPSFMIWIQNTQIRTASESLLNAFQLARAEAVRRNERVTLSMVGFNWTVSDAAGATIQTRAAGEGSTNAVVTVIGTMPLAFNGLGRPVAGTPVVAGADVTRLSISNPTGGACQDSGGPMRCLEVRITASGQVRMCDPRMTTLDSTNPQAC